MAATDKDTIYIDIDDEITGIIDKLRGSDGKVVALVLPKRASVFQSIVNMKLLKRAADSSKKNLVLITSEAGLLPLAGVAGVHVAKTLTSKPEIPAGPEGFDDAEETVQEDDAAADAPVDTTKSLGELASAGAVGADGVETLVLDDDDVPPEDDTAKTAGAKSFEPKAKAKNKKLRIPNFERFRLLLALGGLLLVLIIGFLIFATVALPKATITIKTDATSVDTNLDINLSTAAPSLVESNNTLPAKLASQQKTYTQQVPTTGQKNNGNKASGSITVINCSQAADATIPAGNGFSSGGNTYISQQSVTVPTSDFNKNHCTNNNPVSVIVTAQSAGASYNLPSGAAFTISTSTSCPSSCTAELTAHGDTMSGGTDSIVQSVNQNDINGAKSKITTDDTSIKSALQSQLQQGGYFAVVATYAAGTPSVTSSANVGEVANSVTVTEAITYTMFGVHQSDLNTVVNNNIKGQIDTSKQKIQDNGLGKGVFNVNNLAATGAQLSLSTKATAGPDLNVNDIKQAAAGKKAGAIKSQLSDNPDVTSVDVKLSPFWISTAPKKTDRITVNIAKPTSTAKAGSSGSRQ